MDLVLYDNNRDIDVELYKDVDISLVKIQNNFLYEGFFNAVIVHEEDYDQTFKTAFLDDKNIQTSNISMNNINKIMFYDDP